MMEDSVIQLRVPQADGSTIVYEMPADKARLDIVRGTRLAESDGVTDIYIHAPVDDKWTLSASGDGVPKRIVEPA